jgi:hypothetical protein
MIIFDNNWLRFFERPFAVLFFFLTILGLFWGQFVRAGGWIAGRVRGVQMERGD